jgi:rod shape-determining protein MreC
VTSYASAKYHKGILIGYVNEISTDANNLTKSGSLTPAVDFEHLSTVMVITDLKQQVDTEEANET